jgi:hypothetical protein
MNSHRSPCGHMIFVAKRQELSWADTGSEARDRPPDGSPSCQYKSWPAKNFVNCSTKNNVSGKFIAVVYNAVITRLTYAFFWMLIVSLLSYILLFLVSWCVLSVVSLLSYIMSWPLLYPLLTCTHGTHNPLLLKLDKEAIEGICSLVWYISILLCPCQNGYHLYLYAN